MKRDDFTKQTKRKLAQRVAYKCSNPDCRRTTTGPQKDNSGSTNIGVAAHIHAASENGPRYNSKQSTEQRKSIDNGIWLCQNCAKLVDNDEKRYSIVKLQRWKDQAEKSTHLALERQAKSEGNLDTFLRLANKIPDLLQEMATDLHNNKDKLIREFVILDSSAITFNHMKPRFEYYKEKHPVAQNAVDLLLEYKLIKDVTPKTTPVYRMTEEFVELLTTLFPNTST